MIYYTHEGKPYIKYASNKIDEILKALANAQHNFTELEKNGVNSFFKNSQYSTLKDIFNACGKSLKENKISIISTMARINTKNMFIQTLVHSESGQFLSSSADMGEYDNIHTVGSKITYFRRYLLQPMLNLEGDIQTDDDGNQAQKNDAPEKLKIPKQKFNFDNVTPLPENVFRKFSQDGKVVEEFDKISDYTKKLATGIIKYQNVEVLQANRNEMERVLKYLQDCKDNAENNMAKDTLTQGLQLIDSDNA